jgi:hypothetical protein
MSDIKIQPSATGSATVTLTAPVTNTARTITFPDSTSTLLASDGSAASLTAIPAANITGTLPALSAANLTAIPAANITGTHANFLSTGVDDNATAVKLTVTDSGININGDITFSAASQGIVLGTTSNTDANTLDDYEEGTWQPSFVAGSGSVTAHASYSLCRYTKIGRVVQISGLVSCSGVSSPTGTLQMHGLPFAVDNNTSGETSGNAAIAIGGIVDLAASVHVLTMRPEPGTSYISIEEFTGTTTSGSSMAQKWQNGTYFRFSGTYTV